MMRAQGPGEEAGLEIGLLAYIDGELPPAESVALGQRIAAEPAVAALYEELRAGGRPFRAAFAPLLSAAPVDRLAERLDAVLDGQAPDGGARRDRPAPGRPSRALAICAALAFLFLGAAVLRHELRSMPRDDRTAEAEESDDHWREAVASYLALSTRETVAAIPDTEGVRLDELRTITDHLELPLSPEDVRLPETTWKRAELLNYDGQALAHFAYLDGASGPLALCILAGRPGDTRLRSERRQGMNIVYWSRADRSFLLAGRASIERLHYLAGELDGRLSRNRPQPHI